MQPRRSRIVLSWHEGEEAHSIPLAEPCPYCRGAGLVYSPAWKEWSDRVTALEEQGVSFMDAVERCKPEPQEPEELQCADCEGAGLLATKQGATILQFMHAIRPR